MDIHIDRLSLHAPGVAGPDAERLARQVANGLAGAAGSWPGPRYVESIQANLTSGRGTVTEELSARIVAEILRRVNRTA